MRLGVPIWHGLSLAQKILGSEMPKAELVDRVVKDWEAGLSQLAEGLEKQKVTKPGSYKEQALRIWRECIRD